MICGDTFKEKVNGIRVKASWCSAQVMFLVEAHNIINGKRLEESGHQTRLIDRSEMNILRIKID